MGELIELAVEAELVEFCYLARGMLVVSIGGHQLSYEREEGGSFLRTLVQGYVHAPAEQRAYGPGRAGTLPFVPAAEPEHGGAGETDLPADSILGEGFLEAVLELAEQMRLIRGYEQDAQTGRVTLYTPAVTAEMTSSEALEYLTNSILHELCAVPSTPLSQVGSTG